MGPDLQAKLTTKLTDLLSHCTKNVHKSPTFGALPKKHHHHILYTPEEQSDSDEANLHPPSHIWSVFNDKPPLQMPKLQLTHLYKSDKPAGSNATVSAAVIPASATTSSVFNKFDEISAKKVRLNAMKIKLLLINLHLLIIIF